MVRLRPTFTSAKYGTTLRATLGFRATPHRPAEGPSGPNAASSAHRCPRSRGAAAPPIQKTSRSCRSPQQEPCQAAAGGEAVRRSFGQKRAARATGGREARNMCSRCEACIWHSVADGSRRRKSGCAPVDTRLLANPMHRCALHRAASSFMQLSRVCAGLRACVLDLRDCVPPCSARARSPYKPFPAFDGARPAPNGHQSGNIGRPC